MTRGNEQERHGIGSASGSRSQRDRGRPPSRSRSTGRPHDAAANAACSPRQRVTGRWIAAEDRPGGVGRAERERVFWERVASGRSTVATKPPKESRWESLQLAIVTWLTVVVFGLGWVTLELEIAIGEAGPAPAFGREEASGYDGGTREPWIVARIDRAGGGDRARGE